MLKEGEDFYYNAQGLMVLTEAYHRRRGYCCKSGCLHCPYGFRKESDKGPSIASSSEQHAQQKHNRRDD
jgi:hypothetical protein